MVCSDPGERPSFVSIVDTLKKLLKSPLQLIQMGGPWIRYIYATLSLSSIYWSDFNFINFVDKKPGYLSSTRFFYWIKDYFQEIIMEQIIFLSNCIDSDKSWDIMKWIFDDDYIFSIATFYPKGRLQNQHVNAIIS